MSFQAMAQAVKLKLPAAKKCLMLMLANYADENNECWPSVDRLAEDAGMSRRTVINYLNDFAEENLISQDTRKAKSGRTITNLYRLNIDTWVFPTKRKAASKTNKPRVQELHPTQDTAKTTGRVQELHGGGAAGASYEGAGAAPNTIINLSKDTITCSVTKVTADGDTNDAKTLSEMDALQSADYWIAKMDGSDKWAFDCAIALMGLTETEKAIRSFVASSIKQYGVGLVTEGLLQCIIEQPYNAKDYLAGILHRHKSRTSLSLDWQPATAQVNSLRSKGLTDESIRWALAVFVIWMREREIMHHDWPLAFENWCDREIGHENAQKKADLQRMASRAGITIDPSAIAINEGVGC